MLSGFLVKKLLQHSTWCSSWSAVIWLSGHYPGLCFFFEVPVPFNERNKFIICNDSVRCIGWFWTTFATALFHNFRDLHLLLKYFIFISGWWLRLNDLRMSLFWRVGYLLEPDGFVYLCLDCLILVDEVVILSYCERSWLQLSISRDQTLNVFSLFFTLLLSFLQLLKCEMLLLLNQLAQDLLLWGLYLSLLPNCGESIGVLLIS